MLNKPTNLHPYNEFVDVNNGINFEFTLNNVVENIELDCYSSDDKLVYDTQFSNTYGRLKFTHSLDDTSAKAFASNGNDYYWKVRYWNTPSDVNKKKTVNAIHWDKKLGIIRLPVNKACTDTGITVYAYETLIKFEFSLTRDNYSKLYSKFSSGEDMYVRLTKTDGTIRYGKINNISLTVHDESGGNVSCYIEVLESSMTSGIGLSSTGWTCDIYYFADDIDINAGDYIKIDSSLYKITLAEGVLYNKIPCISLCVDNALSGNISEWSDGATLSTVIYSKADYNESLPAYFSCRITPEISVGVGYDTTTIRHPYVNITGTNPNKVSIGSYVYQVYRVINNKDIFCWESERQNAYGATSFTSVEYPNITPSSIYKLRLIGQTTEGMDFEAERLFESGSFIDEAIDLDFVSFDKQRGCNIIDVSKFRITNTSNAEDWQPNDCFTNILRYDVLNDSLEDVSFVEYEVDITSDENGYYKVSKIYDFNIACNGEYIYYAFMYDDHNEPPWGEVYRSNLVTPTWHGVYITDLTQSEQDYDYGSGYDAYTTDLDNNWFIELNYEPDKIVRNYQINHPMGINSKYPKSIRGKANYKTGTIAGLLGHVGCSTGEYEEGYQLADKFDEFCGNGNPKLIRSHIPGKNFIVDLDTMDTSVYGYDATLVNLSYTQIDDTKLKRINIEV